MTAAAACYTATGIAVAADSLCVCDHAEVRERKIWGVNGWVFAAAGDAAVARWLRAHPLPEIRGADGEPNEDPEAYLWRVLEHTRCAARSMGISRDGSQGQHFVSLSLIACHPLAGIYLLEDGWSVRRVEPIDGIEGVVAIGDPTAVRAAVVALDQPPSLYTLVRAIQCVADVSDVVGGPIRGCRSEDGAWLGMEAWA